MNDEIFEKLKKFTIKESCLTDIELTRSTSIYWDLGIHGDDAVEFFEKFSSEFNVDVSNFKISQYFKGEGDETLSDLINFFKGKKTEKKYFPLILGDLERAIVVGKLDESVIGKQNE